MITRDRIVNQHNAGIALYPRSLSYDLLPLIGPPGWALLRALHDHADEQAHLYRGSRPIAPSTEEMQALAGVGEASLQVIKDLLRINGCLSWEEVRGKQMPRPGRQLKQAPTRSLVYYLHPLNGLVVSADLVQRTLDYLLVSDRAQAYLKANGLLRSRPAFLPTSVWPMLIGWLVDNPAWQQLYQRAHGAGAHRAFRTEAGRWLSSAAEVVATLETEQLPASAAHDAVGDRVVMVMARWQQSTTVPSWGRHGTLGENHGDSALPPHTPLNESINQPINKETGSSHEGGPETGGKGGGKLSKRGKGERGEQNTKPDRPTETARTSHLQADAGADMLAQAEAALWAAVPDVLDAADAGPIRDLFSGEEPAGAVYHPTRSEQRQARRLLRDQPVDTIIAALRATVQRYEPGPGQPAVISRFGFAVGLPAFQTALVATGSGEYDDVPTQEHHETPERLAEDFWHEYRRVNSRALTRAERRRIEGIAKEATWQQLLVWLDRWEQAHAADNAEVNAGYFESCMATGILPSPVAPSPPLHPAPESMLPAGSTEHLESGVLSAEQERALDRLRELGIRRAEPLAKRPGTTVALIDAWWGASGRQGVNNRHAYTAAGVASGQLPDQTPARRPVLAGPQPMAAERANVPVADEAHHTIWRRAQATLVEQVADNAYMTWIAPLRLIDVIGRVVVIAAPNVFVRNEVRERFDTLIVDALTVELGHRPELEVVIDTTPIA